MSDADSHLRNHHIATLCAERDAAIARAEAAEFNFRAALARAEEAERRAAALTEKQRNEGGPEPTKT